MEEELEKQAEEPKPPEGLVTYEGMEEGEEFPVFSMIAIIVVTLIASAMSIFKLT